MSTSKGYKVFIQTLPQQESVTVACICQTGEWKIYYENKERLRNALVEALTRGALEAENKRCGKPAGSVKEAYSAFSSWS